MQNKKGSMVLYYMMMLLIAAVVFVSIYLKAKDAGSGNFVFKAAVATDISLLIDSMYSTPGDVEFIYPTELGDYGINIKDNRVSVFDAGLGVLESNAESYEYVGIGEEKINVDIEGANKLKFIKENNKITVEPVN